MNITKPSCHKYRKKNRIRPHKNTHYQASFTSATSPVQHIDNGVRVVGLSHIRHLSHEGDEVSGELHVETRHCLLEGLAGVETPAARLLLWEPMVWRDGSITFLHFKITYKVGKNMKLILTNLML